MLGEQKITVHLRFNNVNGGIIVVSETFTLSCYLLNLKHNRMQNLFESRFKYSNLSSK